MKSETFKYSTPILISIVFIGVFLFDFLMKLSLYSSFIPFHRYSAYYKASIELFFLIVLIKGGLKKDLFFLIVTMISCFLIGQLFLKEHSIYKENIIEEFLSGDIYHLNKYIFIILFIGYIQLSKNKILIAKAFLRVLIYVLLINAVLIIVGFFFEINMFKSFPNSLRFGYSGLFTKSGEAVLLYVLISILFYIRFLNGKPLYPVLFFTIVTLLTGKKIALFLPLIFYIDYACIKSNFKSLFRALFFLAPFLMLLNYNTVLLSAVEIFPFWKPLINNNGIWTAIFSTRNLNFLESIEFVKSFWQVPNYIFGGVNYNVTKIEIDPLDLFMQVGIIGAFFYLNFLRNYYVKIVNNYKVVLWGFFFMGMFYGAFLFNTLLMPSLFLFLTCIQHSTNHK